MRAGRLLCRIFKAPISSGPDMPFGCAGGGEEGGYWLPIGAFWLGNPLRNVSVQFFLRPCLQHLLL